MCQSPTFYYLCSRNQQDAHSMEIKFSHKYIPLTILCLFLLIGTVYYYFFTSFTDAEQTQYLYIDNDDDVDSVRMKLKSIGSAHALSGMCLLMNHSNYQKEVRPGRYAIEPGTSIFTTFRRIRNGLQTPVSLTIPSVRTLDRLSAELSKRLMMDSTTLMQALTDEEVCRRYGLDTLTIACLFVPNTYDVYWNVSVDKFLDRMEKEHKRFWNEDRQEKARRLKLTPVEVMTLASIVDEETANDPEKPMIAGMYYNRLMIRTAEYPNGMPLQADPTIKYAWKQFDLKRIYNKLLSINSPYNTYRYAGLPPGPIRIPTVAGIDAVLNLKRHHYIYMCAKEDFSGTHNFAVTYNEHLQNARRYTEALNQRGIQ